MMMRAKFGQMNAVLNETLTGIDVVKGSNQEEYEMKKYYKKIKSYRDAYVKQGLIQAKYLPILFLAVMITIGLIHAIYLFTLNQINIGQIITYLGLMSTLRFPTFISIFIFAIVKNAKISSDRLLDFMNEETLIDENPEGVEKLLEGNIKFENVSFSYAKNGRPVLQNISFEMRKQNNSRVSFK